MNNFIEQYPTALSDNICDELIDECESLINSHHPGAEFIDSKSRIDHNIFLNEFDRFKPYVEELKYNLHRHMKDYANKNELNYSQEDLEDTFKLQKSSEGQGFFTWHTEQGHGKNNRSRYAVWMYYLNDVTEGGATEFMHQKISVQPTKGTLVLWPASYTHVHRAAPNLKQEKYILTGWFRYE